MYDLIIVGGGAAGMMAAALASEEGKKVLLVEKNEKLGKKLYITGKGRCNITNMCEDESFFKNVISNPKFMYSSYYGFNNAKVVEFFEKNGLPTKCERGNRLFPVSDKSSDVIKVLGDAIKRHGGEIRLNTKVTEIIISDGAFEAIKIDSGECITGGSCFIATGGLSYPSTGSDGDGYRFARELGHTVTRLIPSLVGIKLKDDFCKELEGLSLKNVMLTAKAGKKIKYSEMGEMLFTRNGISGPLVLTLSSLLGDLINDGQLDELSIDLKPALDEKQLDLRILKDFSENINKRFANALNKLLPSSLIPVVVTLSGISPEKQVNAITKEEREKLVSLIKAFPLHIYMAGGYNEAVITKGGVNVREVNPATMESKIVAGVYIIGELLDVDALTGGFNLQIAWSTAAAAVAALDN